MHHGCGSLRDHDTRRAKGVCPTWLPIRLFPNNRRRRGILLTRNIPQLDIWALSSCWIFRRKPTLAASKCDRRSAVFVTPGYCHRSSYWRKHYAHMPRLQALRTSRVRMHSASGRHVLPKMPPTIYARRAAHRWSVNWLPGLYRDSRRFGCVGVRGRQAECLLSWEG